MIQNSVWLLLLIALVPYHSALALAHYQEQSTARQLMQTVKVGKPMMLKVDGDEFLAIYTKASTPNSRGGVILLNDIGGHPDWPQVIHPLRTQLPKHGWDTLSLQMPLLSDHPSTQEYNALFTEALARIKAGIGFLDKNGLSHIVLIGHSLGGDMGLDYLANAPTQDSKIIAFIGIAMYDHALMDSSLAGDKLVAKLDIPVLDIVGSLDRRVVLDAAAARQRAARQANRMHYQLVKLPGADHFFDGLEPALVERVRTWLDKQAPSVELKTE